MEGRGGDGPAIVRNVTADDHPQLPLTAQQRLGGNTSAGRIRLVLAGTGRDDLAVLGLHAISAAGRHVSHRRRSPITSGVRSGPPARWWTCRSVGAVPIVASTPTTVDALSRGVTQVVAVGAGYDGRAPRYRMPGYDGGRELAVCAASST